MPEVPRQLVEAERAARAVSAVRQVVQAIWALARAQLPLAEAATAEAGSYLDWIEQAVERLAGPPSRATQSETLWIVLGPERPFCGALAQRVLDHVPGRGPLVLVGRRLIDHAEGDSRVHERNVLGLPGIASVHELEEGARRIASAILEVAHRGRVVLLYPRSTAEGLARRTLLAGPRERALDPPETWSPLEQVLRAAIDELVAGQLAVGLAESLLAEVRARLLAADAARRGCDRRLGDLQQICRVLRQEQITAELTELVGGHLGA